MVQGAWVLALLLGTFVATAVSAQTPVSSPTTSPTDPVNCTVEARPNEEFKVLVLEGIATPTAGGLAEVWGALPIPEGGSPASDEVVEAVTITLTELLACVNAGDIRRVFAMFSDGALLHMYSVLGSHQDWITEEDIDRLTGATPVSSPLPEEDRARLEAIEDVQVLGDGRVSAIITINGGQSLMVLVKAGDRYLIDASYELARVGTPTP